LLYDPRALGRDFGDFLGKQQQPAAPRAPLRSRERALAYGTEKLHEFNPKLNRTSPI
jgi:hypothetical protein